MTKKFFRMMRGINQRAQKPTLMKPVDTARKLKVNKTLRRRPGRFANVLCTFNLRPVSTGKASSY